MGKYTLVAMAIALLIYLALLAFVPSGALSLAIIPLRFVLMCVAVVVLHEAVHAIAGRLVGATIYEIGIGRTDHFLAFRLAGVQIKIGGDFLVSGYCLGGFARREATALRIAAFTGAPMLVHLALLVATLRLLSWDEPGLGEAFALCNGWFLVRVAVPRNYTNGPGRESDGMTLWMLLRHREECVEAHRRASRLLPGIYACDPRARRAHLDRAVAEHPVDPVVRGLFAHACREAGDHEEALRRLDDILAAEELDESLGEAHWAARGRLLSDAKRRTYWRGTIYLEMDRLSDAIALYQGALVDETVPEARAIWQAGLALALLLDAQAERAREPAAEAFRLLPWVPYVAGTRAATLLEQPQAALEGLRAAARHDPDNLYRPTLDAWRAIAHARLGESERARSLAKRAEPPFPALRRLAEAAVGA